MGHPQVWRADRAAGAKAMTRRHHATCVVAVALICRLLILPGRPTAEEQDVKSADCASRAAVAARIDKLESRPLAAQHATLLAQVRALEKEIGELPSILAGSCGVPLDRDVLALRVERARKVIEVAAAEERRRKEAQAEEQRLRQAEERRRQSEEGRRQEITAKSWPDQIKEAVLDRKVQIGMTTEQVMAAWGRPAEGKRDDQSDEPRGAMDLPGVGLPLLHKWDFDHDSAHAVERSASRPLVAAPSGSYYVGSIRTSSPCRINWHLNIRSSACGTRARCSCRG